MKPGFGVMSAQAFQIDPAARARQQRAYRSATRHSAHVRWMRRGIVLGAIFGSAALVLASVFDPFRILPAGVSISRVGLNGTKVTMDEPKLTGFRKDGRSYAVSAQSGVQDVRNPTVIELTKVEARIAMADGSNAQVISPRGVYDTTKEIMDLSGDVSVKSDAGYELSMQHATMAFKAGELQSDQPVKLVMTQGSINADTLAITDNGRQISFAGHVQSVMLPAAAALGKAKYPRETEP